MALNISTLSLEERKRERKKKNRRPKIQSISNP